MNKPKISKRLKFMASLIEDTSSIADIGTDHGYLPLYLMQNNRIKHAILCDVNLGPLENAKSTFLMTSYSAHVEFRLGSGIEPIEKSEVDLVIIAGMGGGLIQELLTQNISKSKSFKKILLQPMTEQSALRKWINENLTECYLDYYIHEGNKFYEIITLGINSEVDYIDIQSISDDLEFGYRVASKNIEEYLRFLNHKKEKYQMIQLKSKHLLDKQNFCAEKLDTIQRIQEHLKGAIL